MNIAICDNEQYAIDYLSSLCTEFSFLDSIQTYISPAALLNDIQTGTLYDLVLMDIDYNEGKNGIDYSSQIYSITPRTQIIYVTGYAERFAQHIFLQDSSLIGFLMKPVQKNILSDLLQKAQKALDSNKQTLFFNSKKGHGETIPCSEIIYLESNAHKVYIHTLNNTYSVYDQLSALFPQLPSNFIQCHKSYAVNMDKIKRIENHHIILSDNTCIQISKSHCNKVKDIYFSYMRKSI